MGHARKVIGTGAMVAALALGAAAQGNKAQRPSPPGTATLTVEATKITVAYSRPKIRDPRTGAPRKIMGGLVPYGKVWRAGANEATALTTTGPITLGGHALAAGSYTLFAIPEPDHWTLIISKKTGEWGIPYPGAEYDLARVPMTVEKLDRVVDPFTITLEPTRLCMAWDRTRACASLAAGQP